MDNSEKELSKLKFCYDEQGLLLRYPSKKGLRQAVLAKLAAHFQTGRDYTEKEVNAIISQHIANSKTNLAEIEKEVQTLGIEGHKALHGALQTLAEMKTASRMLTRGQLRANMQLVGFDEPFKLLSDMVNRLTMALIVVGLFIGSSIVYYAGMKPIIFGIPVVGFMGYVIAFILSVWIVFDIYFKGRKKKH